MITLSDIEFRYQQEPVLSIPQWHVNKGERVFLYGESGCGKTSLLKMLCGMLRPQSGHATVCNQQLETLSAKQADQFRARHTGFISQKLNLIPYLSAMDNVLLAAHISKKETSVGKKQLKEKAESLLQQVNLSSEHYHRLPEQLSLGQQQRVAIVRALIHSPELILADEPTSALDPDNREQFMSLIMELCDTHNTTLVMAGHDHSVKHWFSHEQAFSDLNTGLNADVSLRGTE